jgi:hypothetical protein
MDLILMADRCPMLIFYAVVVLFLPFITVLMGATANVLARRKTSVSETNSECLTFKIE